MQMYDAIFWIGIATTHLCTIVITLIFLIYTKKVYADVVTGKYINATLIIGLGLLSLNICAVFLSTSMYLESSSNACYAVIQITTVFGQISRMSLCVLFTGLLDDAYGHTIYRYKQIFWQSLIVLIIISYLSVTSVMITDSNGIIEHQPVSSL